ncbi:putative transcriptional regulator medusa [Erysiphe neolycopersici]|uniref:Putative transcriptional regulator medusa n=1 Tax=Erysiphe neolycopersici TaxID=212602 RepID=A0A420HQA0_9PEZI|nr:putative transcriptional regulator medusa [Erysiphe neolycopersici]
MGRSYPDPHSYTTTIYPSQSLGLPSTLSGYSSLSQTTPIPYSLNELRPAYHETPTSYLDINSPSPQLTSFSPSKGSECSTIYIEFTTVYDITTTNIPRLYLTFGSCKRTANAHKVHSKTSTYSYYIAADVPSFSTTGWPSSIVPVTLTLETKEDAIISKIFIGEFEYIDYLENRSNRSNSNSTSSSGGSHSSSTAASFKRKASGDLLELMNSPRKKLPCHHARLKEDYANYQYTSTDSPSIYSYLPNSNFYAPPLNPSYSSLQSSNFNGSQVLTKPIQYENLGSGTALSPTVKDNSPQTRNWPTNPNLRQNFRQSPTISPNSTTDQGPISCNSSPSVLANPPLFRTSTFHQNPIPVDNHHMRNSKQFNSYSLYPHKAKLEIVGDLNSMAQSWTDEEINCRRRLVLFKRSQSGSTITTKFNSVRLDDRPKDSICISCIYWEEKRDFFITSVDTIYLLQKLVAAQFTVEEKNRIRRNLEGFRPLTVSKGKAESEEFFKIIMAFPTPKPRNIEKDVKVFHWSDLSSALQKIIGKYSASPSSILSTASSLLTPISTTGYTTENSSGPSCSNEHTRTSSPRSYSSSTTSTTAPSIRLMSPLNNAKSNCLTVPMFRGGGADLQLFPDMAQSPWHDSSYRFQPNRVLLRAQGDYQNQILGSG